MTVLTPPRPRLIDHALNDARQWCAGRTIDDRPALVHAVRVAVTLGKHIPDAGPDLIAAALLHDSPEFAPPEVDLDATLTTTYGAEVTRIVRALQDEHAALDSDTPRLTVDDLPVLLTSTADKIVALTSLLRRAHLTGDVTAFFRSRPALVRLLPHFDACHHASAGLIPHTMTLHLGAVLKQLDGATSPVRTAPSGPAHTSAPPSTGHLGRLT